MAVLNYFFLVNPSLTAGLVNFGIGMWIVYAGLKTHCTLSKTYEDMPAEVRNRRSLFRPLCVHVARAAILYGTAYCIGEMRWIAETKWTEIGNPDDLMWCAIEGLSMYVLLLSLRLLRIIAIQNGEKRHRDNRCPDEKDCPVRRKCLRCGETDGRKQMIIKAKYDLAPLTRGGDYDQVLPFQQPDGTAWDMTGCTVAAECRESASRDAAKLFDFNTENSVLSAGNQPGLRMRIRWFPLIRLPGFWTSR